MLWMNKLLPGKQLPTPLSVTDFSKKSFLIPPSLALSETVHAHVPICAFRIEFGACYQACLVQSLNPLKKDGQKKGTLEFLKQMLI